MSVTPAHLAVTRPSRLQPTLRLTFTLLALALVAVLLGQGAPAQAATNPAPSSTANVGPRLGWTEDTVYVQSDATSRWPVKTATERLSQGSPLRLVLVKTCPVRTSASQRAVQCISVTSGDLGGGTLAGTTRWTFAKSTNKLTTATTTLNDRWAEHASSADRLNIAEHELGHAVGLPHVKRKASIMDAYAHGRTKPDAGDLRALNERY